jgi:glycosyltransferase involved in cell wall biosynthesis
MYKYRNQLKRWKLQGVKIYIVLYDILPALYPEWFNCKSSRIFNNWLRLACVISDGFICISKKVKNDLINWADKKYGLKENEICIYAIPLGGDHKTDINNIYETQSFTNINKIFKSQKTAVMVGTLEPRKGHKDIIAAFDKLWESNYDCSLVIVGKEGWKVGSLIKIIKNHKELNKRLVWIKDANDELLNEIYSNCFGLIMASYDEGFGLPINEIMHYEKPILARRIPIFIEHKNIYMTYFNSINSNQLPEEIVSWFENTKNENSNMKKELPKWSDSAKEIKNIILNTERPENENNRQ